MKTDLELIRDKYGEKMMHLCRKLFPTLLETPGLLFSLLKNKFAYSKLLYNDIIENKVVEKFKIYIYSLVADKKEYVKVNKTPLELLSEVDYNLYECKSEEDIQYFKKYYAKGEELCTFNGGRLKDCYVFFAIKKNVDEIKRENFKNPDRQDLYGTSVISIQFSRGLVNTLSIKNRYNHTVNNPDATFSNNLENIVIGLTSSFSEKYSLNINQTEANFFLDGYQKSNDGKYYKYNYEIENIYYCSDNIIMKNGEVIKDYIEKEKYIILDYFIIDLIKNSETKRPEIKIYDKKIHDSFIDGLKNIVKIEIIKSKETSNRILNITTLEGNAIIEIDNKNQIIGYINNYLKEIGDSFLEHNRKLKYIELLNVEKIGNDFLYVNLDLENINIPKLKEHGYGFLENHLLKDKIIENMNRGKRI